MAGECVAYPALEATQGQMDGFISQIPYKCHLEEVASVGDCLKIRPQLDSRKGAKLGAQKTVIPSVLGAHETVTARFWPWWSGKSPIGAPLIWSMAGHHPPSQPAQIDAF